VKTWQKILIPTLITFLIGGIYLLSVWKHRQSPGVVPPSEATQPLTQDDVAVVRPLSPQHFDDLKQIAGTRTWMKNGYTIPYYPYAADKVQFSKRVGLLPALQPMDVKKFIKAAAPANEDDGMGHGSRQVFAVFSIPGKDGLFATPVGSVDGEQEAYFTDLLFFYDDPHGIYSHWPKDVWAAIDAHQVKPGMSELETRLSVGQKMHADGDTEGDRTVTYNQDGKQWTVTFRNNRATTIKTS
jgi:hypothetical protein